MLDILLDLRYVFPSRVASTRFLLHWITNIPGSRIPAFWWTYLGLFSAHHSETLYFTSLWRTWDSLTADASGFILHGYSLLFWYNSEQSGLSRFLLYTAPYIAPCTAPYPALCTVLCPVSVSLCLPLPLPSLLPFLLLFMSVITAQLSRVSLQHGLNQFLHSLWLLPLVLLCKASYFNLPWL